MDGGHPVGWAEMQAWSNLTHTPLAPYEARLIRDIGDVWQTVQNEKAEQDRADQEKARSGHQSKAGRRTAPEQPSTRPASSLRDMFRAMGARRE